MDLLPKRHSKIRTTSYPGSFFGGGDVSMDLLPRRHPKIRTTSYPGRFFGGGDVSMDLLPERHSHIRTSYPNPPKLFFWHTTTHILRRTENTIY